MQRKTNKNKDKYKNKKKGKYIRSKTHIARYTTKY